MYKIVFVISAKGIPSGERREKSEHLVAKDFSPR